MPDLRAAVSVSGLDDLRNRALKLKKDTGNFELTHLTAELSTEHCGGIPYPYRSI